MFVRVFLDKHEDLRIGLSEWQYHRGIFLNPLSEFQVSNDSLWSSLLQK